MDLVQENINFIEIWVKVVSTNPIDTARNKIFIDLGAINEDAICTDARSKAGYIHTEDNETVPTGIIDDAEDTGIDRLNDAQEQVQYAQWIADNRQNQQYFPDNFLNDPAGDDYIAPTTTDYSHINGTENNYVLKSETGLTPDTDDLNRNNTLDKTNSYFEYELNLDTTASNPQRVGGGAHGWYQYRIPLINWKNKVGTPDFSFD